MRYLARRVLTGEWLDRDLPLAEVERTRTLSGPAGLTFTLTPELRNAVAADGLRIFEPWGTWVYAEDDNGALESACLFIDAEWAESTLQATCAGPTAYAQGYIFTGARIWGPQRGDGTVAKPEMPRPDPLQIVRDHWAWLQAQPDSDLGVIVTGPTRSTVTVGDYEEPYRLRWFESPDLGREIDDLAGTSPFDYVEEVAWANTARTQVDLTWRIGFPRLGRLRDDMRFASGENVLAAVTVQSTSGGYANHLIGIGNGEGSAMVSSTTAVRDGRLRRTRVVTDKTLQKNALQRRLAEVLRASQEPIDIAEVTVIANHPNAQVSALVPGDDIVLDTYVPAYGDLTIRLRITAITETDDGDTVRLSTTRSSAFLYAPTTEVSGQ